MFMTAFIFYSRPLVKLFFQLFLGPSRSPAAAFGRSREIANSFSRELPQRDAAATEDLTTNKHQWTPMKGVEIRVVAQFETTPPAS